MAIHLVRMRSISTDIRMLVPVKFWISRFVSTSKATFFTVVFAGWLVLWVNIVLEDVVSLVAVVNVHLATDAATQFLNYATTSVCVSTPIDIVEFVGIDVSLVKPLAFKGSVRVETREMWCVMRRVLIHVKTLSTAVLVGMFVRGEENVLMVSASAREMDGCCATTVVWA